MLKKGLVYFTEAWNYADILNIATGFFNIYSQVYLGTWSLTSKISMIIVIFICMAKTFFFMRIVKAFSYIVTMIFGVVGDLRVFLLFFVILIVMCSMIFDVIAINNADEYKYIGPYFGNMMSTLRLSLGDFDFGVLTDSDSDLNESQHFLFWVIWIGIVFFSSLIFLNFIIAEVSNSYANVKEWIDALVYKERAALVLESEEILSQNTKKTNKIKFPNLIVVREIEE